MAAPAVVAAVAGRVQSTARLNIRNGAPSLAAPVVRSVEPGTSLRVAALVRGHDVHGNAEWFAGGDGTYFWSGGVSSFTPDGAANGHALTVPRRPNGTIRPLSDAAIRATYGDLRFTELGGGRVRLDPMWVSGHITELSLAPLSAIGIDRVQVHVKAAPALERVFRAIGDAGLSSLVLTCAGTFVPRHKGWDPGRELSAHAWGIAIDLNAQWNGYGRPPAPRASHGSLLDLVPLFEAEGFAWGGYFQPAAACDGMHFELARTDV